MEQPDTTNPHSPPSLDDEVASLLESVKSTQVEAPAPDSSAADDDGAQRSASDVFAEVDALVNQATDAALPNSVTKISGDTAVIDEQLDALTRQAADLAAMAEQESPSAAGVAPASEDARVDVEGVMAAVAAEVEAVEPPAPTSAEDAASFAAEMLAKASAAVAEVAPATFDKVETAPAPSDSLDSGDSAAPGDARAEGSADATAATDDAVVAADNVAQTPDLSDDASDALDGLLANLKSPAATPDTNISADEVENGAEEDPGLAAIPARESAPVQSISSLDEQIAQLSENLLNEPSSADAILPQAPAVASPIPAAPSRAQVPEPNAAPAREPAAPVVAAAAAAAPVATPTVATPSIATPAAVATPASEPAPSRAPEEASTGISKGEPGPTLRQRLAPRTSLVKTFAGSLLGRVVPMLAILSAPLAKKPRVLRDSLGWIAVNTVFCASCLWGYMLFLRPAQIAEQHAAFDLANAELPEVPAHAEGDAHGAAAGHEAGGEAGGHEAKKDDGHGAKKDDGHGAKKEAGGHSDAKAGAKKPAAYKPPSRKPPTKADRAKAKPKEAGHGGGGH